MAKDQNLHGQAPDSCPIALLLIDVINDLEFAGGEELLPQALRMADELAALARRAREAGVPVVYVNDNQGRWRSDFRHLIQHSQQAHVRGRAIAEKLLPDPKDYFVLKPKNSGFYCTTLGLLLEYLQARTLILTGIAGNNCVLFTANDAYLRDYNLIVPPDGVVSIREEDNHYALSLMQDVLKAQLTPCKEIDLQALKGEQPVRGHP